MFEKIIYWAQQDDSELTGPKLPGFEPTKRLAIPMMLFCVIDQMESMDPSLSPTCAATADWCVEQILHHVQVKRTQCTHVHVLGLFHSLVCSNCFACYCVSLFVWGFFLGFLLGFVVVVFCFFFGGGVVCFFPFLLCAFFLSFFLFPFIFLCGGGVGANEYNHVSKTCKLLFIHL